MSMGKVTETVRYSFNVSHSSKKRKCPFEMLGLSGFKMITHYILFKIWIKKILSRKIICRPLAVEVRS